MRVGTYLPTLLFVFFLNYRLYIRKSEQINSAPQDSNIRRKEFGGWANSS